MITNSVGPFGMEIRIIQESQMVIKEVHQLIDCHSFAEENKSLTVNFSISGVFLRHS